MKDKLIILFTYGGGMRGLIAANMLERLEKTTGYPVSELVDVFAGPSTGAIINAALNIPDKESGTTTKPLYKAEDITHFYEQEGHKIFPLDKSRSFRAFIHDFNNRTMKISQLNSLLRHGHYNPSNLRQALRKLYGNNRIADTIKSIIVPTYNIDGEQIRVTGGNGENGNGQEATIATRHNFINEGGHALWFKNIKFSGALRALPPPDVKLLDCIMSSTAAPTFFPCHHFTAKDGNGFVHSYSGIDGSIFDNPCTSYLGALRPHLPDDKDVVFIIMGTGYTHRSISREEWNKFGSLGVVDPVNDLPLISIFFHASESALMESFITETGNNLYIFNRSMRSGEENHPSVEIDDSSPENLARMKNFAHSVIEENKFEFEQLCELLVSERDRRAEGEKRRLRFGDRVKSWFVKGPL